MVRELKWLAASMFVLAVGVVPIARASAQSARANSDAGVGLEPFKSDAQFLKYLRTVVDANRKWEATRREREKHEAAVGGAPFTCDSPSRVASATIVRGLSGADSLHRPSRITISGHVLDLPGNPIPGANVIIPTAGPGVGANSNNSGNFSVTFDTNRILAKPVKVTARRIGFVPLSLTLPENVSESVEVEFRLCRDVSLLENVIVTGQGSPERTDGSRLDYEEGEPTDGPVAVDGNFLVILNRGRLFSVSIANDEMRTVSVVDAFGPGGDARGSFQKQIFIMHGVVVVAGPSDRWGGTDISLYRLDRDGTLRHLNTYQIKLGRDFYFSASEPVQLVNGKLTVHAQAQIPEDTARIETALPAMRKWHSDATEKEFTPMLRGSDVYRPARPLNETEKPVLQTVTVCSVVQDELSCRGSAVIATIAQTHSSRSAAYVWALTSTAVPDSRGGIVLYRMPFDGARPTAVRVDGLTAGETSLSEQGGFFNALVQRGPTGTFAPRSGSDGLFLLQIPISSFNRFAPIVSDARYRSLTESPRFPMKIAFGLRSVAFGAPRTRVERQGVGGVATSVDLFSTRTNTFSTTASIQRIDAVGDNLIVSTSQDGRSSFRAVSPTGISDSVAVDGLVRSAGDIDYRRNRDGSLLTSYVVRFPNTTKFDELYQGHASLFFMRAAGARLQKIGQLHATVPTSVSDSCKSSCDDWYADAHTMFLGERIFSVLGYDLIEAKVVGGILVEKMRIDFRHP